MVFKKGQKHTEEWKHKMSELWKKKYKEGYISPALGNKFSLGRGQSAETKRKLSKIMIESYKQGIKRGFQEGNKINIGHKHTEESRQKMSETRKRLFKEEKLIPSPSCFQKGHKPLEITRIKQSAKKQEIPLEKWEKFTSREPYDQKFEINFKRAIRKRDNQICMNCGKHREQLTRALDIHHIDYNKELSIPENCISLCRSCHILTNGNRPHWMKFFQSLLSEKYCYQYLPDNQIIINLNSNQEVK